MQLIAKHADILAAVRKQFHAAPPERIGIAVSGGSDSVALMHILSRCFEPGEVSLHVATVDHGLRAAAQEEARMVASGAQALELSHDVLKWRGWDGSGNLQDQARRARYRLLTDWARAHNIKVLALGHTADDQAETVLMRLGRASGVTGLSAMPVRRSVNGVTLVRPLLGLTREALRRFLRDNDLTWVDDPSNEDDRFERVRLRKALALLEPLGISAPTLSQVAANLNKAREALDWYAFLAARDIASVDAGAVVFDLRQFRTLPDEIARRLIVHAIQWVSRTEYPPRRTTVSDVLCSIKDGTSATVQGCRILRHRQTIWVSRELNAIKDEVAKPGMIWDKRWCMHGPIGQEPNAGLDVRPLGAAGMKLCADWRATGRPYAALLSTPGVWCGADLVAAPLANHGVGWQAELVDGNEAFFAALLSH